MTQEGINLIWTNISAQVKQKQILKNVSGCCPRGRTLAIMGPSGAGKTTLLSILAKKYGDSLQVSGQVLANNVEYNQADFYNFASFVYQNDILNEALTVRETLEFTAKLKLQNLTQARQRVDELIRDFGLHKCQNTYVGGKFVKGISGGEKKRVCIAVQMVTKPSLLILDEPTSGLDSYMANNVLKVFNKLSKKDERTIIFTIHQPSYKMFSELDRLILLDGGECIYQGPAAGIAEYMMSLNLSIPAKVTVCDYFMLEISQYKRRMENYQTRLNSLTYAEKLGSNMQNEINSVRTASNQGFCQGRVTHSFCDQFLTLMAREVKLFLRNPMKLGRGIGNSVLMIIILGVIFLNSISDDRPHQDGLYNFLQLIKYFMGAQGTSFVTITSVIMTGIFSVALVFPTEREVYTKETASKTYQTLPYFLSKLIVEVVTLVISVIIFCSGVYWLTGFSADFLQFLRFILALCTVAIVGNSIGFWTGSLFKDAQRSSAMAPVLLLPLMMFSGLYNKLDSIPVWISWMQYISPFRYGLHAVLINEYGDQMYRMVDGFEFDYKKDLSINLTYWQNIAILLGLSGFYYILAFIFLKKLSSKLTA